MMNSNPETVSTDYDTSDRLYFEPLTVEDVSNVLDLGCPDGIIVQFGGQTPLKLALPVQCYLEERKMVSASGRGLVKIWGTSPDSIDAAEGEHLQILLMLLRTEKDLMQFLKSSGLNNLKEGLDEASLMRWRLPQKSATLLWSSPHMFLVDERRRSYTMMKN
jgi:hypothetical protein